MIKNTSGLAVQPCRLHERFYYHARLLYYILRQKARGFFDAGAEAPADPFFLSASPEGFCGGGGPSTHLRGGAQPLREQVVRLGSSLRPKPRVTFVSRRKSPKACRGCAPGPPWGALSSPQRRCRSPQKDSPIGRRGRCGLVLPSAPDRGLGLPIPFPLFRKKTATSPVGSTGRT